MRLVLDTNVLISGIFWKGAPHQIVQLWAEGAAQIFVTKKILHEYFDVLNRINPNDEIVSEWQSFILQNTSIIADSDIIQLCRDPHDDMFINCAFFSNADYLISGDNDLLSLKKSAPVEIISPSDFVKRFEKPS